MDRRLPLYLDGRGLALCRGRDRPLLAKSRRLVDAGPDDRPTRHRCARDGDLAARRPDALLHHSDQGSQYTSEQFQRLMADNGVVCSMSRSGNVWDNAAMESFFSSLKTERIGKKVYRSRDAARADVFDYIERFYNPRPDRRGDPRSPTRRAVRLRHDQDVLGGVRLRLLARFAGPRTTQGRRPAAERPGRGRPR